MSLMSHSLQTGGSVATIINVYERENMLLSLIKPANHLETHIELSQC